MTVFYKVVLRAFEDALLVERRVFLDPLFFEWWCLCFLETLEVTLSLLIRSLRVFVDKRPETRFFERWAFLVPFLEVLRLAAGIMKKQDNKQKIIKFELYIYKPT